MTTILRFKTIDEEINNKIFEFNSSITVEEMLNNFLSQTNSKKTLETSDIAFLFGTRIINKGDILKKPLSSIFKSKANVAINVRDMNNVIGGD